MAELRTSIQHALQEARILVLGTQVLLGFQLRAFLERAYGKLDQLVRHTHLAALGGLLVVVALLLVPGAYHRIVEEGRDSRALHRLIGYVTTTTTGLIAVVVSLEFLAASFQVLGPTAAFAASGALLLVGLSLFYGIELIARARRGPPSRSLMSSQPRDDSDISQRISHLLTEARLALPGSQALLGFQVAIVLGESFPDLPRLSQHLHIAALGTNTLAMMLLMTPTAYHRLVEGGEDTEGFHRVASRFMLAALIPIALSIALDVYVVLEHALARPLTAASLAAAIGCAMLTLWLGMPLVVRHRRRLARAHADPNYGP